MADSARQLAGTARIGRNIIANYLGLGISSLLSLALVPVYIRYLGIEAYALVGLFVVVQSWMNLLDLGMTPTLGREMARFSAGTVAIVFIHDLLRSLETVYVLLGVTVALLLTLGAPALATHWLKVNTLPLATVSGALSMLGVVVALRFCEGIYRGALMGLQQQVWVNAVATGLALLRALGALAVLAWVSATIQAFFVWQGLVSLLTLVTYAVRLHSSLPTPPRRPRFSPTALHVIKDFAAGVFGISLLGVLLTQLDKLLLSRLLSLIDFGYYMLASTIAGGLWLTSAPIILAVAPVLVRHHENATDRELAQTYHRAAQLLAVALAPAALVLMVFPGGVLMAWSGDAMLAAATAPILPLLALGTFLNALMQLPYQLQMAAGWTSLAMRINLVAVTAMVPTLLLAVPRYGAIAAAAIWVVINIGYLLVMVPLLHRRLLRNEMWHWYAADVAMPVLGAAMVVGAAFVLRPLPAAHRLVWLAFTVATGLAATCAAALMAGTVRDRMMSLIARQRPGSA